MPRKCSYHPDTFCYMHGDLTLNLRGKLLARSLRNVMSCILGVQWVTKKKVCPSYLLRDMCEALCRIGQWLVQNAVHHSGGLEGTKRPIIWLLLLLKVFQVVSVHLVYNSALFLGILFLFISATCHSQFNLYLFGFLSTGSASNATKIYYVRRLISNAHSEIFCQRSIVVMHAQCVLVATTTSCTAVQSFIPFSTPVLKQRVLTWSRVMVVCQRDWSNVRWLNF